MAAARAEGLQQSQISKTCRGETYQVRGYKCWFAETPPPDATPTEDTTETEGT
jgi:hypothetical protein